VKRDIGASTMQAGSVMLPSLPMTRKAKAKLNLLLEVGPKDDGLLHKVFSVMTRLELADELQFLHSEDGFAVTCDDASIRTRDNLVWRAVQALGVALPPVRIHLRKHIPLQAGLGGGSADAAAALREAAELLRALGTPVSSERLMAAALQTGSDVPACLHGGLQIVSGHGEQARQVPGTLPAWGIVLLKPNCGMPSARAYEQLDSARALELPNPTGVSAAAVTASPSLFPNAAAIQRAEEICAAILAANFRHFCNLVHNDFQKSVEHAQPEVADARRRLEQSGATASILCGSGSCVAGFFESAREGRAAHDALPLHAGEWSAVTRMSNDG